MGRKRHILVDSLGLLLKVVISEASLGDREAGCWLLQSAQPTLPRLELIWADAGYRGPTFAQLLQLRFGLRLHVISRPPAALGFQIQPRRWVVERTFGWLNHARRLSKDYELYFKTSASMLYVAMIRILIRRLAALSPP
jgi:putative transposase